ncbi:DNA repair protein endonuclease SAE2/CtIP C-terminus-domain-containing protein [Corynascus novoguineensis]|uniref:DNA repair protein endonuclease SAE2/CtIP C-terminus-domain-containing protein n=1 Tax=Corynascus novoguineensis TaxID=1126955 RepID=A0AAN7CW00_9PEZI|nr:DNA repair protein endonuclease SAE2/CtIP C-terminus-domain-containing protein [Corynascus novoguineensis]
MAEDGKVPSEAELDEERKEGVELLEKPLNSPSKSTTTMRPALAELSTNSKLDTLKSVSPVCGSGLTPDWKKEYLKLAVHCEALQDRLADTGRAARRLRRSRDGWTEYAQSLEAKIKVLERKLRRKQNTDGRSPAPNSSGLQPAVTGSDDALCSGSVRGSHPLSNQEPGTSSRVRNNTCRVSTKREEEIRAPKTPRAGDRARSIDEETLDESDSAARLPTIPPDMIVKPDIAIKEEPSSDAPVIVSERCVRKRKYADDNTGIAAPPRRIKSERSTSSDPVITGEVPAFCPQESIDLDEEERWMPTPRKPRNWERNHLREEEEIDERFDQPHGETRSTKTKVNTPARGPDARRIASSSSPHKPPMTHNKRVPPIRAGWTLGSGIADVAEETPESFYSPEPPQIRKKRARQSPAHSRLHSLLNEGSPNKTAALLFPARHARDKVKPCFGREDIESIVPEEGGQRARDVFIKPSLTAKAPTEPPLQRKPGGKSSLSKPSRLRDRPLTELRPEDFKINPKSNNGYKYAFDEVVRNREERAELAGCTDPNCCGKKFRAMAESELSAGGPGILSRVADIKMMEEYLGHEAHRLDKMAHEERQETWLKARIQDLADRYGRHRHKFARRPSPPGYWNPDFPSTQEIEANKKEAQRLERGVVEERWREAMRGGMWQFRDE